jgi:hypothetical protein
MRPNTTTDFEFFKDSKSMRRFQNEMYLERAKRALESFGVTEQLFLILKIKLHYSINRNTRKYCHKFKEHTL